MSGGFHTGLLGDRACGQRRRLTAPTGRRTPPHRTFSGECERESGVDDVGGGGVGTDRRGVGHHMQGYSLLSFTQDISVADYRCGGHDQEYDDGHNKRMTKVA